MPFKIEKDNDRWIIAGTGPGWQLIPKQSNAIICCLNDYVKQERFGVKSDYLFMMDILPEKPSIASGQDNLGDIIHRINKSGVPFIGPYKYAEIPKSEAFPIEEIVEKFGISFFTNTICYMIAFALYKGAKELELYGINQAGSYEYIAERGAVETWLGFALGMGVKVTIYGNQSQVLRHQGRYGGNVMYGYGMDYADLVKAEKQYGKQIIYKLTDPEKQVKRQFRSFKTNDKPK